MQLRATDSKSFWISGAQWTNSCVQNLKVGFLISSMKVIRSPQGWGLFTINLSNSTLQIVTIYTGPIFIINSASNIHTIMTTVPKSKSYYIYICTCILYVVGFWFCRPEIQYVINWRDKRVSTNEQYEEPSMHIVSIGNHEKGMKMHFQPPHNEMKYVLCIKESYSKGRKC